MRSLALPTESPKNQDKPVDHCLSATYGPHLFQYRVRSRSSFSRFSSCVRYSYLSIKTMVIPEIPSWQSILKRREREKVYVGQRGRGEEGYRRIKTGQAHHYMIHRRFGIGLDSAISQPAFQSMSTTALGSGEEFLELLELLGSGGELQRVGEVYTVFPAPRREHEMQWN